MFSASTSQAFKWTALGHGALFFLLLVSLAIRSCSNEEPHTFILHDASPPMAQQAQYTASSKESPSPETKSMSYEDFLKSNKVRKVPAKTTSQVTAPKIEIKNISKELDHALTSKGQTTKTSNKANLGSYIQNLKNKLDSLWRKPQALAGRDLRATVEFSISGSGGVTGYKITRSSGNNEFDNSIIRAFKRTNNLGVPPENKPYTFSLTFKMLDS